MRSSKTLVALAGLLTCIGCTGAQRLPPGMSYVKPPLTATALTDWLSVVPAVEVNDSALQELLPRLYDYWVARESYDRAACRRFITSDFTFESEMSGDGLHTGAGALEGVSDYTDRPDGTFRDTGRVLKVHKLFAKKGKIVLYLTETLDTAGVVTLKRQEPTPFSSAVSWYWKQTWVKSQGEWKLASVVNRNVQ